MHVQQHATQASMKQSGDRTRVIFWVDMLVLLVLTALLLMGQWDWVLALFLALVVLNFFDRWWDRRRP
jgi:hypothetical protein